MQFFCYFINQKKKKFIQFSENLSKLLPERQHYFNKAFMPRNIMISEDEQNTPQISMSHCKDAEKRSSVNSNLSDNESMMDSKWKTNLFISDQVERVERRDRGARKNTSFENKIINDHIKVMVETVCEKEGLPIQECQKTCNAISREECLIKEGIVKQKVHQLVDSNTYLTEDEKSDFIPMFGQNFDNYQILVKSMNRLGALSFCCDQLAFILFKVVEFISKNYEMKLRKYDEDFMEEEVPKRLAEISSMITNHENVKLINPEYFYNTNEAKFITIIERWFYCIFAIKLGVYANKYYRKEEGETEMVMM